MLSKKELILDTMQKIMTDNESNGVTISDVAKKAGIAKGSVYYYFDSKDEIIDAVIERAYSKVIEDSKKMIENPDMSPFDKFREIFNLSVYPDRRHRQSTLLNLLHIQDNVVVHQKFCVIAVKEMTPILTKVIEQGISEGVLKCDYPERYAEFILSMIVISLDRVLIPGSESERYEKFRALAQILETSMQTEKGSFSYLYSSFDDSCEY